MARKSLLPSGRSGNGAASSSKTGQWHAVEIRCGPNACEAARAAAGRRLLSGDVPFLPLPDCDRRADCDCRYRHHADRRAGPRRAAEGAPVAGTPADQLDRRYMEGLRDEDRPDWLETEEDDSPSILEDTYYDFVARLRSPD